jgi:hypothetical protein
MTARIVPLTEASTDADSANRNLKRGALDYLPSLTLIVGISLPLDFGFLGLRVLLLTSLVVLTWSLSSKMKAGQIATVLAFLTIAQLSQTIGSGSYRPDPNAIGRATVLIVSLVLLWGTPAISDAAKRLLFWTTLFVAYALCLAEALGLKFRDFDRRVTANYSDGLGKLRATSWLYSPNELGLVSAMLVVAFIVVASRTTAIYRYSALSGCIVSAYLLFQSATRSALIACGIGLFVLLLHATIRQFSVKKLTTLFLVAVSFLYLLQTPLYIGAREVLGRDSGGSASFRENVRETLWERVLAGDANWFGTGFLSGNRLRSTALNSGVTNIDNSIVYTLVAFGLLGLAVIFVATVIAIATSTRTDLQSATCLLVFVIVSYSEDAISWPTAISVLFILSLLGRQRWKK